jgi:hypothetical protein
VGSDLSGARGGAAWRSAAAPRETRLRGWACVELRNFVANYPFESSRGFPGSEPNCGQGDHSRLSCSVEEIQLGPAASIPRPRGRHWSVCVFAPLGKYCSGSSVSVLRRCWPSSGVAVRRELARDFCGSNDAPSTREVEAAARSMGHQIRILNVSTDTEIERPLRHSLSHGRMRLLWLAIPGRILTISFISNAYLSWSRRRGLWSYSCLSDRKCKRTARVSRTRARVLQIVRCSYDFANIRTVVLLT